MKIFPIKVEPFEPAESKIIEWKLHNVCNHDCSFCTAINKDGSERWLTLDKYKEHVDRLTSMSNVKTIWFRLTGGEPTLYPDLLELIIYIKSKGAMVSMISNGSRTIRWWKELSESNALDYLFLSYHPEQTDDWQHISDVANLFHNAPVEVNIAITHTIPVFDKAVKIMDNFVETTGSIITLLAMNINGITEEYTKDQYNMLKNVNWKFGKKRDTKQIFPYDDNTKLANNLVRITYNNTEMQFNVEAQSLIKIKQNNFLNWECFVGKDFMRIEGEKVYRGVCKQGPVRNLFDPNINFTNDSIICKTNKCTCSVDVKSTKILPESMYPLA